MEYIKSDMFMDGGTLEFETTAGTFYRDRRLGTKTEGTWFAEYPTDASTPINAELAAQLEALIQSELAKRRNV